MKYPRTYERPCRFCRRPMVNAARNQQAHAECMKVDVARRRQRRREIRRAAAGLFPGEKTPKAKLWINRRPATAKTRGWYRWHSCPKCGKPFYAGWNARLCPGDQQENRRRIARKVDAARTRRRQFERVA